MSNVFAPTPAELSLVSRIFAFADPQKLGVLTGDVAVRVFGGAKLSPTILGEIWNIADEDNNGWLSKKGVAIAIRLIGWAQKGEAVTQALVNKPGPLPAIEGVPVISQQNTGISLPKSPPPQAYPPLTPQDKTKFQAMFARYGPSNGILSGEKARDIFVKSKLSNDQLLKIWNLADTQDRGALDVTDFIVGMYFIQGAMTGKISHIPAALPPGLYQQAGGVPLRAHMTGASGSFSPVSSAFQPQVTGQSQTLQPDYTGSYKNPAPNFPPRPNASGISNGHALDWDVTPVEKAASDRHFDSLDVQKRGFIEGEIAVPFMLKSQLPGEVLAQVWDLADINNDGRLTREGFAIAMHLIQKKLAGQEIPITLPPSLVPPSSRMATIGTSPFVTLAAQNQKQPEPTVDLFSFDDDAPGSAAPSQSTHIPSGVTTHTTGPNPSAFAALRDPFFTSGTSSRHQDLLGDDDIETTASPPLQDQSAEIGNLKNQLQSTNKSLAVTKEERETLEQTLANQASILSTIQTQLSSAKAAYETETSLLSAFKERRATQISEIQKSREELIRAESDLSAIRVEKAEIEGALLRDKEEARELHKRMIEVGQQAEALKADVEKLKKEAKQQKGLLAIARKQLSTKEHERAKVEKEHEEAIAELTVVTQEKDSVEADTAALERVLQAPSPSSSLVLAAAQPLPVSPDLASPASKSSNNPFERLAMASGHSTPRSQSPFLGISGTPISSPLVAANGAASPGITPQTTGDVFTSLEISAYSKDQPTELSYLTADELQFNTPENVLSPVTANGTEVFLTPPTSAKNDSDSLKERFPSLDDISSPKPETNKVSSPSTEKTVPVHNELALNSEGKELEIEESDSDDDDVPLKTKEPAVASAAQPTSVIPSSEIVTLANTFDDVFSSDEPFQSKSGKNEEKSEDLPANEFEVSQPSQKSDAEMPVVAGVNEFDEALGKIPASNTASPTPFSFDAAFDDNFDFTSASNPVDSAAAQTKEQNNIQKPPDFDDIFSVPMAKSDIQASPPSTNFNASVNPKFESSFDETFLGFDSTSIDQPKAILNAPHVNSHTIPSSFPSSPVATTSSPTPPIPKPTSAESKPASPPPREKSPPPRVVSPHPRVSLSSKEVRESHPEKTKEPRSSKLSIRLPFGKKKKNQEQPMPSVAQHLTPPIEQPNRMSTPASDDDVEPVKQLTAMGFSRTQAVEALEKSAYDVPKALNSLLGTQ